MQEIAALRKKEETLRKKEEILQQEKAALRKKEETLREEKAALRKKEEDLQVKLDQKKTHFDWVRNASDLLEALESLNLIPTKLPEKPEVKFLPPFPSYCVLLLFLITVMCITYL